MGGTDTNSGEKIADVLEKLDKDFDDAFSDERDDAIAIIKKI